MHLSWSLRLGNLPFYELVNMLVCVRVCKDRYFSGSGGSKIDERLFQIFPCLYSDVLDLVMKTWTRWICKGNGMRVPQEAKKHMGMRFIQHMRPHGTIIKRRRWKIMRCFKKTDRVVLHLKYKEDHPHVQHARWCCLLALGLKWHRVRLMTLLWNECVHISERKSIEWMNLSYVNCSGVC